MRFQYTLLTLACLLALLPGTGFAGTPFNVDDPGTAEPLHLQIDLATVTSQVRGSESDLLPSVSFGYGYNNTVELDLCLAAASIRSSGSSRVTGLGDTTAGAKWRFQEETANRPQIAVTGQIKFPTASRSKGLGTGRFDYTPGFSLAKSFGHYALCAGAGYNFVGDPDAKCNAYYGICLTCQSTQTLVLGAQLYGNSSAAPGTPDELAYGIGLSRTLTPDETLQVMVGRSTQGLADLNVYVGLECVFGPKAQPSAPVPAPPVAPSSPKLIK